MRKPQLFLLHFAGGNCYSYQKLTPLLKDFDTIPLELPGRGRRMAEGLLTDYEQAAQDFYRQITQKLNTPEFAIYGHSMGATLGIRVVELLEQAGKRPVCLFVSGNAGPGVQENRRRYQMPKGEFITELKRLGGLPTEVIESKELFDFFEPVLRADFEVAEENQGHLVKPLHTPFYAMMGSEEENVDQISNWKRFSRRPLKYEVLEGDHFFIMKHPDRISEIIRDYYGVHSFSG